MSWIFFAPVHVRVLVNSRKFVPTDPTSDFFFPINDQSYSTCHGHENDDADEHDDHAFGCCGISRLSALPESPQQQRVYRRGRKVHVSGAWFIGISNDGYGWRRGSPTHTRRPFASVRSAVYASAGYTAANALSASSDGVLSSPVGWVAFPHHPCGTLGMKRRQICRITKVHINCWMLLLRDLPDDVMCNIVALAFATGNVRRQRTTATMACIVALLGRRNGGHEAARAHAQFKRDMRRVDSKCIRWWRHSARTYPIMTLAAPFNRRCAIAYRAVDVYGCAEIIYFGEFDDTDVGLKLQSCLAHSDLGPIRSVSTHLSVECRFFAASPWPDTYVHSIRLGDESRPIRYTDTRPLAHICDVRTISKCNSGTPMLDKSVDALPRSPG